MQILIDGSNLIHKLYHCVPADRVLDAARRQLRALEATYRPEWLVVCLDWQGPNFRHDLWPEYKAGRDETPADLRGLLDAVAAGELGDWMTLVTPGYEADDLIATLSSRDYKSLIVSADKDLYQCLRPDQVAILNKFSTRAGRVESRRYVNYESLREDYGLIPPQWPEYRALVGDKSDNMRGVRGVGPDAARSVLDEFPTIEDFVAAMARWETPAIVDAKAKAIVRAWESGEIQRQTRVHRLVRDVPIQASVERRAARRCRRERAETV